MRSLAGTLRGSSPFDEWNFGAEKEVRRTAWLWETFS